MNQIVSETHIAYLPEDERPYEKCVRKGPEALSDAELLAVLLRTGTKGENVLDLARRLCRISPGYPGILGLFHCTREELLKIRGIGQVKAIQIQCITELSKRFSRANIKRALSFNDAASIAHYYMEEMRHLPREELRLIILDGKNRLLKESILSRGTVNMSVASVREIFRDTLNYEGVNIIFIHNHPSGDATPSTWDFKVTEEVRKAGDLIGIKLLDHIIIGDNRYASIQELTLQGKDGHS